MGQFYARKTNEVTALERENQQEVRKLAGECMVLLENDGALPLRSDEKRIALYGNGARHTVKGGTGSGDVNTRENIHVEQGLLDAGFDIVSGEWLDRFDAELSRAEEEYMESVEREVKERGVPVHMVLFERPFEDPQAPLIDRKEDADAAVYVLSRNSGEGKDREYKKGDYLLTDRELDNIRFLAENYEKTILMLNIGGVIDTAQIKEIKGLNAIVLMGQLGNIGGYVAGDVLAGKTYPSGRLTDTWAKDYYDYPSSRDFSHNNGNVDDEYYTEEIFVGYRYFDTHKIEPSYCFGYGKSYTQFAVKTEKLSIGDEGGISLEIAVTNTGTEFPGREVVQVYYSAPEGELSKPYQELAAFAKTRLLKPGETERLAVSFKRADMASYSTADAAWVLEPGEYTIRVGTDCAHTDAAGTVRVEEKIVISQLTNRLTEASGGKDGGGRYKERPALEDKRPKEHLTLSDVKEGKASIEELAAQLTLEEMAELCVGIERRAKNGTQVVGNAAVLVPGAAGETSSTLLRDRGIFPLILADGPAGLRLQPHFKATEDGEILPGGEVFGMNRMPFPEDTPEGAVDYYQFCTAIPIATTLAQSLDMDLMEKMGRIVGKEMKEYNIHLWLAPGMNIHRNPLCGRNFEYYSEDPLLSGRCAAADTKGVQSFGGQGTTIKHFAANNQEDNRMFTNAHISERALREIYLKGFEIAVKEAKPYSIMTSYNLINGIHTANSYDLLQAVARDEWGFDGVIMTDWCTSQDTSYMGLSSDKYPWSSSEWCIKAGNDLQMPGCEENIADIVDGVKGGEIITLGDLQFCTCNLLRVILRCMA